MNSKNSKQQNRMMNVLENEVKLKNLKVEISLMFYGSPNDYSLQEERMLREDCSLKRI